MTQKVRVAYVSSHGRLNSRPGLDRESKLDSKLGRYFFHVPRPAKG
jgi:hypothetical protein